MKYIMIEGKLRSINTSYCFNRGGHLSRYDCIFQNYLPLLEFFNKFHQNFLRNNLLKQISLIFTEITLFCIKNLQRQQLGEGKFFF